MIQEQYTSPEDEIRALEEKLEQKKKELSEKSDEVSEEKDVLREVLKQHIEEARPSASPSSSLPNFGPSSTQSTPLSDDLKKHADNIKSKEALEEQVRALIEIAMTRSIQDAVKVAEAATPYLIDELHDHLVDDYYDKLISLRKLKLL